MTPMMEACLWATGIVAAAAGLWSSASSIAQPTKPLLVGREAQTTLAEARLSDSTLAALSETVVQKNLFRLERRPSKVPFGFSVAAPSSSPLAAKRPTPLLVGIVGGPPWQAVFEADGGAEGSVVVSIGETVAGYRILKIDANHVVLQATDTTISIRLRRFMP